MAKDEFDVRIVERATCLGIRVVLFILDLPFPFCTRWEQMSAKFSSRDAGIQQVNAPASLLRRCDHSAGRGGPPYFANFLCVLAFELELSISSALSESSTSSSSSASLSDGVATGALPT